MTKDEQRAIVRQQQAGFELFRQLEEDAARQATLADRLAAFKRIQGLRPYIAPGSRDDDEEVTRIWTRIRERYDASKR